VDFETVDHRRADGIGQAAMLRRAVPYVRHESLSVAAVPSSLTVTCGDGTAKAREERDGTNTFYGDDCLDTF
jgi:hypothetical protein